MQTLFEIGFVLAVVLPAAAVILSVATLVGSSFVYWRSHAGQRAIAREPLAIHHPVGR